MNPFALIVEMIVVAIAGRIEDESTPALEAREAELQEHAIVANANALRQMLHGHRIDKAQTAKAAADIWEELAAIQHVLHERTRRGEA